MRLETRDLNDGERERLKAEGFKCRGMWNISYPREETLSRMLALGAHLKGKAVVALQRDKVRTVWIKERER